VLPGQTSPVDDERRDVPAADSARTIGQTKAPTWPGPHVTSTVDRPAAQLSSIGALTATVCRIAITLADATAAGFTARRRSIASLTATITDSSSPTAGAIDTLTGHRPRAAGQCHSRRSPAPHNSPPTASRTVSVMGCRLWLSPVPWHCRGSASPHGLLPVVSPHDQPQALSSVAIGRAMACR